MGKETRTYNIHFHRRESYPLIVKASDLVSSLDVQEFGVGKYVVKWAREGESRSTTTTFELTPLKVKQKVPNSTLFEPGEVKRSKIYHRCV